MIGIERVNADDVRRVIRAIKQFDPEILKILRQELRGQLGPIANQIAAAFPDSPPPSVNLGITGFAHNGRTGWGPVRGSVSFTPGKTRKQGNPLVSMAVNGPKGGPQIAELAGMRTQGNTASGRAMINYLNGVKPMKGRGGRFGYNQFRLLRPDIQRIAQEIVNRNFAKLERLLD